MIDYKNLISSVAVFEAIDHLADDLMEIRQQLLFGGCEDDVEVKTFQMLSDSWNKAAERVNAALQETKECLKQVTSE